LHGAKPSKSLAWLLAIFTIPVGGMFLYLLLGRNRRKNKLLKLKKKAFLNLPEPLMQHTASMSGKYRKLMTLVYRNSHFPPTEYNELGLLKDGKTTFESIFEALENAQYRIHLQYYIFEEGELTNRLLLLFERKIAQGVEVRMIYDGVGSFSLSKAYLKKLMAVGVAVYPFLPFKFGRFFFILKLSKPSQDHSSRWHSGVYRRNKCIGQIPERRCRIGQLARHAFEARRYGSKSFGFCICNGLVPGLPKDHIITTLGSTFGYRWAKCRKTGPDCYPGVQMMIFHPWNRLILQL